MLVNSSHKPNDKQYNNQRKKVEQDKQCFSKHYTKYLRLSNKSPTKAYKCIEGIVWVFVSFDYH